MSLFILKRNKNFLGKRFLNGRYTRSNYITIFQNDKLFAKFYQIKNKYYLELVNRDIYVFDLTKAKSGTIIKNSTYSDSDSDSDNLRLEGWFWKNSLKNRKCLINVAQKNSYQKLVPNTLENNRLMTSNTTSDNYTRFDFNSPRYLQLININQKILGDVHNLELALENKWIYNSSKNINLYNFKTEVLYLLFRKIGDNTFLSSFCHFLSKMDALVISCLFILG
jgi:hypothetical protein